MPCGSHRQPQLKRLFHQLFFIKSSPHFSSLTFPVSSCLASTPVPVHVHVHTHTRTHTDVESCLCLPPHKGRNRMFSFDFLSTPSLFSPLSTFHNYCSVEHNGQAGGLWGCTSGFTSWPYRLLAMLTLFELFYCFLPLEMVV